MASTSLDKVLNKQSFRQQYLAFCKKKDKNSNYTITLFNWNFLLIFDLF